MQPKDLLLLFIAEVTDSPRKLDRIRLMKGMFIFTQEAGVPSEERYHFEPWTYGPCSFDLYDDLADLKRDGLVVEEPPNASWGYFRMTDLGQTKAAELRGLANPAALQYLRAVKAWTLSVSFHDLLRAVYRAYPEFARNTVLPHLR